MSDEAKPADTADRPAEAPVAETKAPAAAKPKKPEKLDPETIAIRQKPERPIQIKRNTVIGLSAGGMLGLGLIGGFALTNGGSTKPDQAQDTSQSAGNVLPDGIRKQPADYGAVPQLGPPLPGDLGKPILERQQQMLVQPIDPQRQQAVQAAEAERQQLAAQGKAARESGLLFQSSKDAQVGLAATPGPNGSATATAGTDATHIALDPERDPNGQQRKSDFVAANDKAGDIDPHRVMPSPSPYTLSAGSVIAASLMTGLRSDLPGLVTAQVTENVFDSSTGQILLVPQGARLIGKYDSVVAFGQKRALVVWQRLILPDGGSISLDNMPASDPSGYAGLQDKVDFHTWQLLKGVAISTLLGVGSDLQFSGNGGLIEAIRQSGQQNVARAGNELTAKVLDIQPTLTIRPGAPVRLLVDRDLILAPWHG